MRLIECLQISHRMQQLFWILLHSCTHTRFHKALQKQLLVAQRKFHRNFHTAFQIRPSILDSYDSNITYVYCNLVSNAVYRRLILLDACAFIECKTCSKRWNRTLLIFDRVIATCMLLCFDAMYKQLCICFFFKLNQK